MTMRAPRLGSGPRMAAAACGVFAALALAALVAACSSKPAQPDWQMNAADALQRALSAYLSGDARIEAQEFAKARSEVARTGRADLLARTELARCAPTWRRACARSSSS